MVGIVAAINCYYMDPKYVKTEKGVDVYRYTLR